MALTILSSAVLRARSGQLKFQEDKAERVFEHPALGIAWKTFFKIQLLNFFERPLPRNIPTERKISAAFCA